MYQIEIANSQVCQEVDEGFLIKAAERVLAEEEVAFAEISVALVDDETIHRLNREYLGHDYATDVLSFLLECDQETPDASTAKPPEALRGKGKRLEGEVIISTETASRDAKNFGWSPREEVVLYLIHGLLHLVGYDDLSSTERKVMRARERAMLAFLEISPPDPPASDEGENASQSDEDSERPASAASQNGRTES